MKFAFFILSLVAFTPALADQTAPKTKCAETPHTRHHITVDKPATCVVSKIFEPQAFCLLIRGAWLMISELAQEQNFDNWMNQPVSEISHHATTCCETAREFLISKYVAKSRPLGGSPWAASLREIQADFPWGVSAWPIHWCELPDAKHLDCGALSALSREVLSALGIAAHAAQIIHRKPSSSIERVEKLWSDAKVDGIWTGSENTYHELCVIESKNGNLLYDTSYGLLIDQPSPKAFNGLRALRIQAPHSVEWAGREFDGKSWSFFDAAST